MQSTTDLHLAAAWICKGNEPKDITVYERRGTFYFDSIDEQFVKQFGLGLTQVEPLAFINNIRRLNAAVKQVIAYNG